MGVRRKQVDGDKFVCLDLILDKDSCIVYSFGVARDWTFEDQMDNIGSRGCPKKGKFLFWGHF